MRRKALISVCPASFTWENAETIQAKLIAESVNIPIIQQADEQLSRRDAVILPNLLAKAGGVLASHYEWLQNLQQFP